VEQIYLSGRRAVYLSGRRAVYLSGRRAGKVHLDKSPNTFVPYLDREHNLVMVDKDAVDCH